VTYYGPASITSFGPGAAVNDTARTIAWTVPFGTDLATLAPIITVSSGTCVPASGAAPNFAVNNPATYTVTDGATINTYAVAVTVALGTSPGTTINVNLANASGTNSLNGTPYMAGGFAQAPVTYAGTTWNEATNSPATQPGLLDSEGNPSPFGFTTASTTGAPDMEGPTTSAGAADVKLLKGCVYRVFNSTSGNTLNNRLTISGFDPAKTYNIYLASGHNTPVKCSWRIGATGVDKFIANTAATRTAETWVAGDNYVAFYKVSPDATGKILVYGTGLAGGDNGAFSGLTLNGFQVVDATGFLSPENDILSFSIPGLGDATISGTNISLVVPTGTPVTGLAPTYTISSFATCSPASGSSQNFSSPVQYTVTAENGAKKVYNVTVTTADGMMVKTYLGVTGAVNLDPISNLMALTPSARGIQVANIDYHGASFSSLPGSPGPNNFSILWDGWFDVTQDGPGDYTFGTSSDDGSVIYLDLNNDGIFNSVDELIVSNNRDQGDTPAVGTVTLNMDSVHIVIGYYEGGGGYDMRAAFKKGAFTAFGELNLINGISGYFYASQPGPQAKITSFGLPGSPAVINSSAKTIAWMVPNGTAPSSLAPEFTLSPGATCNQTSGAIPTPNLGTGPVPYKVISSDNLITNVYTVTVTVLPAPPVASGLACWYAADYGVTANGSGAIMTWDDISGNAHHATVARIAPVLALNDVNSKPAVHIRGNQQWLDCAGAMFTKEQYVVVRSPNATWNGSGSFLARQGTGNSGARNSSYNMANGTTGFWQDHFPTAVSKNGTPVAFNQQPNNGPGFQLGTITDYMILKIVVDDTGGDVVNSAFPYYQIGQNDNLGSCDMDIAEIIGYGSSLSGADEALVGSYLAAKYGLTAYVPFYDILTFGEDVAGSSAIITTTSPTTGTIAWTVPPWADVATLAPTYTVSIYAREDAANPSGTTRNFTTPKTYTITSADLTPKKTYTVTVTVGVSPVNDNFANAIALPGDNGTRTGTGNVFATLETGEPDINGANNTVWFKWTCAADGSFTINTLGSSDVRGGEFDSMLGIYTGDAVDALTPLLGTPQDTGVPETMSVAVTAGTTYHIQVAGWNNTTAANILLTWSFVAPSGPISVGASGSGPLTFDTQPSVDQWSTLAVAGAAGDVATDADLDSAMAVIDASSINTALTTQPGSGTSGTAYWRSGDQKLGTQPTGVAMTLLMATLKNTSGSAQDSLKVSYTMGLASVTPAEAIKGHRVYWSKTGAAGTWTAAGDFLLTAPGTQTVNFDLTSLAWANGESLYVVWADDNGSNPDGDYTIDNVSFAPPSVILPIPTFVGGKPTFDIPNSVSGKTYTLEYRNNLSMTGWTALTAPEGSKTGNGGTLTLKDESGASPTGARFYRLSVL
jgi:hypothetical protein